MLWYGYNLSQRVRFCVGLVHHALNDSQYSTSALGRQLLCDRLPDRHLGLEQGRSACLVLSLLPLRSSLLKVLFWFLPDGVVRRLRIIQGLVSGIGLCHILQEDRCLGRFASPVLVEALYK